MIIILVIGIDNRYCVFHFKSCCCAVAIRHREASATASLAGSVAMISSNKRNINIKSVSQQSARLPGKSFNF